MSDTLDNYKALASAKLLQELKNSIGDFFAAAVLDENDVAAVLLTLLAGLRVEIGAATGIAGLDAMLQAIGEQADMVPIPEQPLQ